MTVDKIRSYHEFEQVPNWMVLLENKPNLRRNVVSLINLISNPIDCNRLVGG